MEKELAIITVLGQDRVGIVAGISSVLAENSVNIEDISQTVMEKCFTMVLMVDISGSSQALDGLRKLLSEEGKRLGVEVTVQHEDLFQSMHRI